MINTKYFGLRTGAAAEKVSHLTCRDINPHAGAAAQEYCATQKGDAYAGTIYQTVKLGPLSAGFQATYKDPGTGGGIENNQSFVGGIAITIGSALSFSCGKGEDLYYYSDELAWVTPTQQSNAHDGGRGQDKLRTSFRGCSAAGNWGPLALKYVLNSVDNMGGTHRDSDGSEKHSEINLSMAF